MILAAMKTLVAVGLKPLDALHVACAQALECEYFLTVDKGILKKANLVAGIRVLSPLDFVFEQGA